MIKFSLFIKSFIFLFLYSYSIVYAQSAYEALDNNNINALFNNTGSLFWDQQNAQFEAPAGSGLTSIYSSSLWFGALDANLNVRGVAEMFLQNQQNKRFYVGPVTNVQNTSVSASYDRIFRVSCSQISEFRAWYAAGEFDAANPGANTQTSNFPGYSVPLDIVEWPGNGDGFVTAFELAPYVDVNLNGFYDWQGGDYPLIKGEEMLYFILNDKSDHTGVNPDAMGVEFHVSGYTLNAQNSAAIDNTIYVNYRIVNRSNQTFTDAYVGVWTDLDLGGANDDYVACFPMRNAYYAYNGDNFDEASNGALGYENYLAAQGILFLNGVKLDSDGYDNASTNDPGIANGIGFGDGIVDNERYGITSFLYHNIGSGSPNFDPTSIEEYYAYLQAVWKDGTPMVHGGNGHINGCGLPFSCDPTKYMFPGIHDPLNLGTGSPEQEWTEVTAGNSPGDRRALGSMGPFTITPGSEHDFDIAYVFARTTVPSSAQSAVGLLGQYLDGVRSLGVPPLCAEGAVVSSRSLVQGLRVEIYPNPTNNFINISFPSSLTGVRISLENSLGQTLLQRKLTSTLTEIDLNDFAQGTYFLKLQSDQGIATKQMIKQ